MYLYLFYLAVLFICLGYLIDWTMESDSTERQMLVSLRSRNYAGAISGVKQSRRISLSLVGEGRSVLVSSSATSNALIEH